MGERKERKAHRDKLLNGGTIIPIPEAREQGSRGRSSTGALWGMVAEDPKPFVMNTKHRGQLLKIIMIVRMGYGVFQRVNVASDDPFFLTVRALKKGDRVLIFGVYTEFDSYKKQTGEEKTYRDVYPGFIIPQIAITDPKLWLERLTDTPDPFYEAQELLEEREAKKAADEFAYGFDYSAEAIDAYDRKGW